ncbi:MAG: hypothetical protein A2Y80_02125 [Deltaproteobacteria bacterium RBG_13_58_19]|nr:MAG: hypothetical protein A2Y80_02125 [Deltaproteobacteria bacterium RBG_13_58_19]
MGQAWTMPLYTLSEVKAKIEALDAKIAKAEQAQSYQAGAGMQLARGDLAAMYKERDRWIKEYDRLESTATGGFINKAQFQRPT